MPSSSERILSHHGSSLYGMDEMLAEMRIREHQREYQELNSRVGPLIKNLTGQDVFDPEKSSEDDLGPQEWKPELNIDTEAHVVSVSIERSAGSGMLDRVVTSFSTATGLLIAGQAIELQLPNGVEGTDAEIPEAFERALANPEVVKKVPPFLRQRN